MKKKTVETTGSVSWGTMRPIDLIPKFMAVLGEHWPQKAAELTTVYVGEHNWPYCMAGLLYDEEFMDDNPEATGLLLDDLFYALDDLAPEGHYFGAHPGDGCDYGFWKCEEDW